MIHPKHEKTRTYQISTCAEIYLDFVLWSQFSVKMSGKEVIHSKPSMVPGLRLKRPPGFLITTSTLLQTKECFGISNKF